MFIFNIETSVCEEIIIDDLPQNRVEKNWVPFVLDDRLHLLYSINPLVVLRQKDQSQFSSAEFEIVY